MGLCQVQGTDPTAPWEEGMAPGHSISGCRSGRASGPLSMGRTDAGTMRGQGHGQGKARVRAWVFQVLGGRPGMGSPEWGPRWTPTWEPKDLAQGASSFLGVVLAPWKVGVQAPWAPSTENQCLGSRPGLPHGVALSHRPPTPARPGA